jgi:hypothetical protein
MPAVQECDYKLEVFVREYSMAARSGCVGIEWDTIALIVSERLINKRLLDTQEATDIFDLEAETSENGDSSFQIPRDGVISHSVNTEYPGSGSHINRDKQLFFFRDSVLL